MSIVDDFLLAMQAVGLSPAKNQAIKSDCGLQRYRVEGDRAGSLNGWYNLHSDSPGAGWFGSWKTGETHSWFAKAQESFAPEEKAAYAEKRRVAKLERDAELAKIHAKAEAKAKRLWELARPAVADNEFRDVQSKVHPYLINKGIKPYGIRQLKNMLVIPVRNAYGQLMSLQFIQPDGTKRFITGGKKLGGYFSMGTPVDTVLVCEGVATGASLFEATQIAVAVAFDAGNLCHVAKAIREKFPGITIVICADNDIGKDTNTGLNKATEVVEQNGYRLAKAEFEAHEKINGKQPTDFNDLHMLHGLEAVRAAVVNAVIVSNVGATQSVKSDRSLINDLKKLIDETDDFDLLTGDVVKKVASAGLPAPAFEYLISQIKLKTGVSKSALLDELNKIRKHGGDDDNYHIKMLNQMYSVCPVGGRVLVVSQDYDPCVGRPVLNFISRNDFAFLKDNNPAPDGGGLGTYWIEHPKRRTYKGLVFSPGKDIGGYLNLWHGWGVNPVAGECDKYLDFVADIICAGRSDVFDYVIKYLAHMVQYPRDLPGTSLVLRGVEGCGKNTFVDPIANIVGQAHVHTSNSLGSITGRFSGHLANVLLVFINEGVWGGDKSAQGLLKAMITDPEQSIEFKGKEAIRVKNYRRNIFATNEDWAVPRGIDDRRFITLDVLGSRVGDYAFWDAIQRQMANGGTEALFHYLLNVDLTGWHPRNIPASIKALGEDLKIRSLSVIEQWWLECLSRGWIIKPEGGDAGITNNWHTQLPTCAVQASYVAYCNEYKKLHIEQSCVVGKSLHAWGFSVVRPRSEGRKPHYRLPELEACRDAFAKRIGSTSLWGDEVD